MIAAASVLPRLHPAGAAQRQAVRTTQVHRNGAATIPIQISADPRTHLVCHSSKQPDSLDSSPFFEDLRASKPRPENDKRSENPRRFHPGGGGGGGGGTRRSANAVGGGGGSSPARPSRSAPL